MRRTRVKICGVTSGRDAELAVTLGAEFVGVNFHAPSPRYVSPRAAREIAAAVGGRARVVGVFVNQPASRVEEMAESAGCDLLQFHGDETPEDLMPVAARAIKALRIDGPPAAALLEPWRGIWGFLVEGRHPSLYGGSGEAWAYEMIGSLPREKPLFVAGGLAPQTVREVVAATVPWGVDVCSGVESAPGVKDETLMRRFFDEVRRGES